MIKLPNLKALQVFLGRLSKKDKIIFYIAVFVVSLMVLDRAIISPVFNKIRSLNKEVKDEQATIKKNLRILAQKDRILSEGAKYSSFLGDAQLSDDEQITLVLKEIESL
ncbi:MAG TPA: hypothetical protein PKI44_07110, partial [Candidatus Omnitrophota bacterium]|nr:hypothetical protein [Candidatus Omnitrophota bacterium]